MTAKQVLSHHKRLTTFRNFYDIILIWNPMHALLHYRNPIKLSISPPLAIVEIAGKEKSWIWISLRRAVTFHILVLGQKHHIYLYFESQRVTKFFIHILFQTMLVEDGHFRISLLKITQSTYNHAPLSGSLRLQKVSLYLSQWLTYSWTFRLHREKIAQLPSHGPQWERIPVQPFCKLTAQEYFTSLQDFSRD